MRDLVAEILDRVADFAPTLAERFLHFTRGLVGLAFVAKLFVTLQIADALLDIALQLIRFAVHFILIPHRTPPRERGARLVPSAHELPSRNVVEVLLRARPLVA